METESLKQLTEKYDRLIEELNKYSKIYSELSKQSREIGKGSFGFLDTDPNLKHGWFLMQTLEAALSSLHLVIDGNQDKNGECRKKCIGCFGIHYDKASKRWSCQVTCECK